MNVTLLDWRFSPVIDNNWFGGTTTTLNVSLSSEIEHFNSRHDIAETEDNYC